MFLVSQLLDLVGQIGGPRLRHRVRLMRLKRWGNFDREYYLLDHLVDSTRAAVDVGANIGDFAGRMSQLCPTVHCFEPIPWLADALRVKLDSRVVVHQCALSNCAGLAELRVPYLHDAEMHGGSTLESRNRLHGYTHVSTVSCEVARLDAVLDEPVGFIKIDVEGHEQAVLEGAIEILRAFKPILLIESERRHNPSAPENIFGFLSDCGYTGLFLRGNRLRGLSAFRPEVDQKVDGSGRCVAPYVCNFIFFPNDNGT
jgi:FkbM family methyltransferase